MEEIKITGEVQGLSTAGRLERKIWGADEYKKKKYDALLNKLVENSMFEEEDILKVSKDDIGCPNILKGDQVAKKMVE